MNAPGEFPALSIGDTEEVLADLWNIEKVQFADANSPKRLLLVHLASWFSGKLRGMMQTTLFQAPLKFSFECRGLTSLLPLHLHRTG